MTITEFFQSTNVNNLLQACELDSNGWNPETDPPLKYKWGKFTSGHVGDKTYYFVDKEGNLYRANFPHNKVERIEYDARNTYNIPADYFKPNTGVPKFEGGGGANGAGGGSTGSSGKGDLGIDKTNYGRSASGLKVLKNDFNADIEGLVKILNGDKYAAFKKIVTDNWVGADADDFISDVEKTRADLEKSLRSLKNKFNAALDADAKQFKGFQSKNVK